MYQYDLCNECWQWYPVNNDDVYRVLKMQFTSLSALNDSTTDQFMIYQS